MPGSYELHLFRQKPSAGPSELSASGIGRGKALEALDERAIGDFLLAMGQAVRLGGVTALGDQYLYEDEQGGSMEIVVSENEVALGFPNWYTGEAEERMRRVAYAVSLALVARFGLTLYDPQTNRFVRGAKAGEQS